MTFDEKNAELRDKLFSKEEQSHILSMKKYLEAVLDSGVLFPVPVFDCDYVIAGVVFVSYLTEQKVSDKDIFLLNSTTSMVSMFDNSSSYIQKESSGYKLNPSILRVYDKKGTNVQIILTTYQTREELLKDFDFVHCMVSYHKDNLYITRQMYEAIMAKKLIPNKPKEDIRPHRIDKYVERGFTWA